MTSYPSDIKPLIDELAPLCRALGEGRYAISIGGSYGKGTFDRDSDLDLRLFCERRLGPPEAFEAAYAELQQAIDRWAAEGLVVDGCWVRTIDEIETQISQYEQGNGEPEDIVWTIWGYHVLTDVFNQMVIEDPHDVLKGWQRRLSTFPPKHKAALLEKHLTSLRYWRNDYHYQHKVDQGDVVFLAGITSKLVHDILRVLFALNETYYPGDGKNLAYAERFERLPEDFTARVTDILYSGQAPEALGHQYQALMSLIDDLEAIVSDTSEESAGA